ncbi:MAG: flagellar biosynthetic protein FliO [Dechloromonas sp.]|nr:flagellar biosynthetic protein FliO [Dechloromonas sp.]
MTGLVTSPWSALLRSLSFLLLLPLDTLASTAEGAGLSSGTYLQAILALLVIVGLLFGTAWLARKVSGGKSFGQGRLKVLGGVALGPRERLVLVEAGDTWLVIGIVPGQIRTLHRMPRGDEPASDTTAPPPQNAPFAHWLKRVTEQDRHV